MRDKKKKKGGKRAGAGRKPSGRQKEAVTVYTDVSKFGGKEGARIAIYEFLDGIIFKTGESKFLPLSDEEVKQSSWPLSEDYVKANKIGAVKSEAAISETAQKAIREQIEAIRAEKIPKERDTPFGRKSWQIDQQKRIQELQNKLK